MENQSIEELIYSETQERLATMESSDYVFPAKIGKGDVIGIVGGIVVSALLIVLCMLGVIK